MVSMDSQQILKEDAMRKEKLRKKAIEKINNLPFAVSSKEVSSNDSSSILNEYKVASDKYREKVINNIYFTSIEIEDGIILKGKPEDLKKVDLENLFIPQNLEEIYIKKNASFKGNIEINNAVIAGNFEGTLKVNNYLYLESSATLKGKLLYKTIRNNGATISGTLKQLP